MNPFKKKKKSSIHLLPLIPTATLPHTQFSPRLSFTIANRTDAEILVGDMQGTPLSSPCSLLPYSTMLCTVT